MAGEGKGERVGAESRPVTGGPGRALVTGAAGFIGSHLCQRLLREGYALVGIDAFTDYYPRRVKEANLAGLAGDPRFTFREGDLLTADLPALLDGATVVFHQAAQPGVRGSWGAQFRAYVDNNILATQRLLEASRDLPTLRRFVFASSSSVYGNTPTLPLREDARPEPYSPYGVTKLAGESLALLYGTNYGVPVVALRYFTVYGPRQRPDMAFHRFCVALLRDEEVSLYGDGHQTRDFTFVGDVVEANLLALGVGAVGQVFNIGGGARVPLREALAILEQAAGRAARIRHREAARGDVRHTYADTDRARQVLGYKPQVALADGLREELAWVADALAAGLLPP